MSSHTHVRASHTTDTNHVSKDKISKELKTLHPTLEKLYLQAKAQYEARIEEARKADDEQPVFTSTAENFIKGGDLMARIALRSANNTLEFN